LYDVLSGEILVQ